MLKHSKSFVKDECGAVTVDWVVISAAVVGMAILVYNQINGPTGTVSTTVGQALIDTTPETGF